MKSSVALRNPVGTSQILLATIGVPFVNSGYVQVEDSTTAPASAMRVTNTTLGHLMLAIGPAGQEKDIPYIVPSNVTSETIPCEIPVGSRVSVKVVPGGVPITAGAVIINFLG